MKFNLISALYMVCAITFLNASDYQRNNHAIEEFSQTLANVDAQEIFSVLDEYFKNNPTQKNLHPQGVDGSAFLCPLPGEKGEMDPTLTLLRMDPKNNFTVAEAQFRYAINDNKERVVSAYAVLVQTLKSQYQELDTLHEETISEMDRQQRDTASKFSAIKSLFESFITDLNVSNQNLQFAHDLLKNLREKINSQ
ncbi:MAG: hypothetical protein NEHIOOID_00295 [Holosporales bacterium]